MKTKKRVSTLWFILLPITITTIILFSLLTNLVNSNADRITLREVNRSLVEVAKDIELTIRTLMINDPREIMGFYRLLDSLRGDSKVLGRLDESRIWRLGKIESAVKAVNQKGEFAVLEENEAEGLVRKYHQQLREIKKIPSQFDIGVTIIPSPVVRHEKLQDVLEKYPDRYPLPSEIEAVVIATGKQFHGNIEINGRPYLQITTPIIAGAVCTACHTLAKPGQPLAAITTRADLSKPKASIAFLTRRLITIGAVIIGIILITVYLVSRRLTTLLSSLSGKAIRFGEGDYDSRIESGGTSEVVSLANSFEDSRIKIHDFINDILKSIPSLLFIIEKDGSASANYSQETETLFGPIENRAIDETVFKPSGKEISSVLEMVFSDSPALSFDELMAIAPNELDVDGQIIQLKFHPIVHDQTEQLEKILVVGKNITALRQSEAARALEQKNNEMILEIVKNPDGFLEFYEESLQLVKSGQQLLTNASIQLAKSEIVQIQRVLHTIKGAASIFQLYELVAKSHEFEDQINNLTDRGDAPESEAVRSMLDTIVVGMDKAKSVYQRFYGEKDQSDLITVTREEVETLINRHPDLESFVETWNNKLLLEFIERKAEGIINATAKNLGKEVELDISGEEGRISKQKAETISLALTHLLRNAISHGIEEDFIREEMGKEPKGNISITVSNWPSGLEVVIKDDGKGINPSSLIQSAIEKGVIQNSSEIELDEALDLIFASGFSTAEEVSSVSGRGVGLDAVKHAIEENNGSISVKSREGFGTIFTIFLKSTRPV